MINLNHEIHSQDLQEAGYIVDINAWYFPPNTVHVIVVDPGVGTHRRVIDDPIRIPLPVLRKIEGGLEGEILHIDKFGNIHINIEPEDVADFPDLSVEIDGKKIDGMVRTFGDSEYGVGKLIALWDSNWRLMVSENDGYGRKVLKVKPGDKVRVRPYTK